MSERDTKDKTILKRVATFVLLLFAVAGVVYAIARENPATEAGRSDKVESASVQSGTTEGNTSKSAVNNEGTATTGVQEQKKTYVLARYLHGNARCISCQTIEKYATEAITSAFKSELESGRLVWNKVNVETSLTYHLIREYQLSSQSLILTEEGTDSPKAWKKLDKIWELLGNKSAFITYVQEEIRSYLGESK